VLLVAVPAHRAAVVSSPELRRRAPLPRRAVRRLRRVVAARAALDGFAASCTSLGASRTRYRAPNSIPRFTAAGRPPLAVNLRHSPPAEFLRAFSADGSRSGDPDLTAAAV
jgi:hypothetical protein